ncbi:MAG TPA: sulfur oxidation c-type cytochrome SoxA [Janthinobacterium sp.]|jgi:sulfur-oxidizing protein SoxA|nr:sulfur oxidation c-type cytochrome SoxA [Janthinobacterium sp.]
MKRWLALIVALGMLGSAGAGDADARRSGFEFMSPSTQAMQRDDMLNPAMLWAAGGAALWNAGAGKSGMSCAACHGDAKVSMRGVAARYPAFDALSKGPLNLGQRINQCRQLRQQAAPLKAESEELLGIETYVAMQSRGLPLEPPQDARLAMPVARGQRLFFQRRGQLNLSCAQCHDDNAGKRLGSSTIPQAHAAAYPIYRLEWQGMGSLQRRLRNCISGVRAEVPEYNAQELVELELYLAARDKGMKIETPAVRP